VYVIQDLLRVYGEYNLPVNISHLGYKHPAGHIYKQSCNHGNKPYSGPIRTIKSILLVYL